MPIDRREAVFVSSIYADLRSERQEVIQTLIEADCLPTVIELFPASDDDRWTLIKRVIDDSDYYLILIGSSYGSMDPDRGPSHTETELDYAAERGIPIMGFCHRDPQTVEAGKPDLEPSAREKLNVLIEKVSSHMVKYWSTADQLGGAVAKSLIQIRKTHPREGWVRAGSALTPEREQEIAELRERVAELTAELQRDQPPSETATGDLAQGSDPFEFDVLLRYHPKDDGEQGQTRVGSITSLWTQVSASWDAIFANLGPLMMDEATELALNSAFDRFAEQQWVKSGNVPADFGRRQTVIANQSSFQDLKVQLFSLGLITQSARHRAVPDTETYWKLTSRGRDHLMRLRAIRRVVAEKDRPVPLNEAGPADLTGEQVNAIPLPSTGEKPA
jgi:hypothetical protein